MSAPGPTPRLVTFDVYSALLDYERTLLPAVREACGEDAAPLLRAWRAKQLEYAQLSHSLPGGRISFRLATRRALDYVLARAGQRLAATDADRIIALWARLALCPEADAVRGELKARGYRLAMLSNGDEEMLRAASRVFTVAFDHLFASDQAGYYKPHPAIYALPSKGLGLSAGEVLHVAGSGNDVLGAKLSGLRCAWANRTGDRMIDPDVRPDYELRDLTGLLDILPGQGEAEVRR